MEPFDFYNIEVDSKSTLNDKTGGISGSLTPLVGPDFLDLPDLDPSLEEPSVDLQQLINRVNQETPDSSQQGATSISPALAAHQLFPDLLGHPAPDSPAPERQETNPTIEETPEAKPMPVVRLELSPNGGATASTSASHVLTIQPNDLQLSSISGIQLLSTLQAKDETVSEASTSGAEVELCAPTAGTTRNTLKAPAPSRSGGGNRRKVYEKGSVEYQERRERNNVAVRKSRDKAKKQQLETQNKVQELSEENERLNKKVDLLTKELTVLKGLFTNVGAMLPPQLKDILK